MYRLERPSKKLEGAENNMKNEKKIILFMVGISIFGASICSAAGAAPTFGEITVSPTSPAALSTVTLSVTISGETPSEVRVTVEECNGRTGICYPDKQNVTMTLRNDGTYKADVTLKHADATYLTCQVNAKTDNSWVSSADKNINLSENTNGNTNGGDGNTTPGFELLVLLVALGALLIITRRKRGE